MLYTLAYMSLELPKSFIESTAKKVEYSKSWEALFLKYNSLTAKEFSELTEIDRKESEKQLNELSDKGTLKKLITKNGCIWKLKNTSH